MMMQKHILLLVFLASYSLYVAGFNATITLSSSMTIGFDISLNASRSTVTYLDSADVNADGIDDLLIGIVAVSGPYSSVYVLFGNNQPGYFPSHLVLDGYVNGKNGFEIRGATVPFPQKNWFGGQISSGDIDGDGISDIIACDGTADSAIGACYVVFGSKSPFPALIPQDEITGEVGFTITGSIPDGQFGAFSVAFGDINGDHRTDLLIGTPRPYNGSGEVYVLYGSPECRNYPGSTISVGQLNGDNGFTVVGWDKPEQTYIGSTSGLAAGDINNDGYDDIIMSQMSANHYFGRIVVLYGSSSFPATFPLRSLSSNTGFMLNGNGGWLGFSAAAGDVNADGVDDLIGGAVHATTNDHGAVYVLYGGAGISFSVNVTSLNGTNGFSVQPASFGAGFGWNEITPDLNGDGIRDLCVGAPQDNSPLYSGSTYVVFGQKGEAMPALVDLAKTPLNGQNGFKAVGTTYQQSVGSRLASGDLNNDALDDLLISSDNNVYVIYGSKS